MRPKPSDRAGVNIGKIHSHRVVPGGNGGSLGGGDERGDSRGGTGLQRGTDGQRQRIEPYPDGRGCSICQR